MGAFSIASVLIGQLYETTHTHQATNEQDFSLLD